MVNRRFESRLDSDIQLYRYLTMKGGAYVIVCELVVIPLVTGIVSGVISAYIVRFLDKRHKNDRHAE